MEYLNPENTERNRFSQQTREFQLCPTLFVGAEPFGLFLDTIQPHNENSPIERSATMYASQQTDTGMVEWMSVLSLTHPGAMQIHLNLQHGIQKSTLEVESSSIHQQSKAESWFWSTILRRDAVTTISSMSVLGILLAVLFNKRNRHIDISNHAYQKLKIDATCSPMIPWSAPSKSDTQKTSGYDRFQVTRWTRDRDGRLQRGAMNAFDDTYEGGENLNQQVSHATAIPDEATPLQLGKLGFDAELSTIESRTKKVHV